MKNVDEMSPKELRALADQKEQNLPVKEGFLKHNLYYLEDVNEYFYYDDYDFGLVTDEQKTQVIKNLKPNFKLVIPKGTRFECVIINNTEIWCEDHVNNWGVRDASKTWAKEHLENIREIKQNKKTKK